MLRVVVLAVIGVALTFLVASTVAADPGKGPVPAATEAALRWLDQVDGGDYAGSWADAAPKFQAVVGRSQWLKTMEGVRKPLGDVVERTLADARFTSHLPGAPDGAYVVLRFATTFENKAKAIETVTPMRTADGTWKVAGYYIR